MLTLSPAYLQVNYGYSGSLSAANVAKSDTAVEVKTNNTDSRSQSIKYQLPPILLGTNGYPCLGSSLWIATQAAASTAQIYLNLGWLNEPGFATTANQQWGVGFIDINFLVEFAQPILF
jgi:hypothetical protein